MDCVQRVAKMIVDKMDELGWLQSKDGDTPSSLSAPTALMEGGPEQLLPQHCNAVYSHDTGMIEVDIEGGIVGLTYELKLVDENGKRKSLPQIALYVRSGQKYYFKYKVNVLQTLYVSLIAIKKGFANSEPTLSPVTQTLIH